MEDKNLKRYNDLSDLSERQYQHRYNRSICLAKISFLFSLHEENVRFENTAITNINLAQNTSSVS